MVGDHTTHYDIFKASEINNRKNEEEKSWKGEAILEGNVTPQNRCYESLGICYLKGDINRSIQKQPTGNALNLSHHT